MIDMENPDDAAPDDAGQPGVPLGRRSRWPRSRSRRSTRPASPSDDLDVFVPHQANMRIIDAMARVDEAAGARHGRPRHRDQGNTSAASIPLALDRMIGTGEAKSGDTALLIAFGAGLAYAAQVVTLP